MEVPANLAASVFRNDPPRTVDARTFWVRRAVPVRGSLWMSNDGLITWRETNQVWQKMRRKERWEKAEICERRRGIGFVLRRVLFACVGDVTNFAVGLSKERFIRDMGLGCFGSGEEFFRAKVATRDEQLLWPRTWKKSLSMKWFFHVFVLSAFAAIFLEVQLFTIWTRLIAWSKYELTQIFNIFRLGVPAQESPYNFMKKNLIFFAGFHTFINLFMIRKSSKKMIKFYFLHFHKKNCSFFAWFYPWIIIEKYFIKYHTRRYESLIIYWQEEHSGDGIRGKYLLTYLFFVVLVLSLPLLPSMLTRISHQMDTSPTGAGNIIGPLKIPVAFFVTQKFDIRTRLQLNPAGILVSCSIFEH